MKNYKAKVEFYVRQHQDNIAIAKLKTNQPLTEADIESLEQISRDSEARVIADAKYKPIDNIGNKDYLQVLAYMFRFDAKKGFYFYPEMGEEEDAVMWLNRGSTYEKNVEAREDICLIKYGFQIPTGIDVYSAFTEQMRCNEIKFLDGILTSVK